MQFNSWYKKFHWFSLVFIYLVIIAGSVVRTSGSGMGCPDWPRCFGKWVPPTSAQQLPDGVQDQLLERRITKAEKFASLLEKLGMEETAKKLRNDPYLQIEEPFNARRTWTEYVNRLVGFVAGNLVLILFIWTFIRYRKDKLLLVMCFLNLVFISFEGWFGSIVVASNLVPWTITVHLLFALIILGLQFYLIYYVQYRKSEVILLNKSLRNLLIICLLITFAQMFLGTQVREFIDALRRDGFGRDAWSDQLGWVFWIHRSFSWIVLILLGLLALQNEKKDKNMLIRASFAVLTLELVSGVTLAYLNLPAAAQVMHLVLASVILGQLWFLFLRSKSIQA